MIKVRGVGGKGDEDAKRDPASGAMVALRTRVTSVDVKRETTAKCMVG